MKIIRKQLAPLVAFAFPTRYVEETDEVQASFDGGETWEAFPEGDPRLNNHTPPPDSAEPRCDAAERIAAAIEETLDAVTEQVDLGASVLTVVAAALRLLTPLFTYVPFLALVYALMQAILSIGSVALHSAFDTFDWDDFKCLIYCRMGDDGRLTETSFGGLLSDIAATYSDAAETVLYNLCSIAGFAGLNDQAGIREEAGNCSGCDCEWDIFLELEYWWNHSVPSQSPGNGCAAAPFPAQGYLCAGGTGVPAWCCEKNLGDTANRLGRTIQFSLPEDSTLEYIYMYFVRSSGNTDQFTKAFRLDDHTYCVSGAFHNSPVIFDVRAYGVQGGLHTLYLGIGTGVASDATTMYISSVRMIGTGAIPDIVAR